MNAIGIVYSYDEDRRLFSIQGRGRLTYFYIEGYLFNKPVIASNICAIPEVIISEAFLFDNTVESIIEKLQFAKLKLNGPYREFYNDTFSNATILNQFGALYKKLM